MNFVVSSYFGLKPVLTILREHVRSYGNSKLLISVLLLLCGLLYFNYSLNFEDDYIDTEPNLLLRWLWMFLMQALPYLTVCLLLYLFNIRRDWLKNARFWVYFLLGFALLALDRSVSIWPLLSESVSQVDARFVYRLLNNGKSFLFIILPLLLLYVLVERENPKNYYGIAIRKFDARPYFAILAIALIFVTVGGFFGDIQAYYPKYARANGGLFAQHHQIPEWIAVLLYEIPYGLDFISTEYFFRGFLVIGMYRVLGPYAVLPMVAAYCVLHFGKPLTESVSSIFGGYMLGVIAIKHRSIWGGVIIHVGVAWMMELVGFLWRL